MKRERGRKPCRECYYRGAGHWGNAVRGGSHRGSTATGQVLPPGERRRAEAIDVLPPGERRRAEAIDVLPPGAEAKGVLPLKERRTGRMPQGSATTGGTS